MEEIKSEGDFWILAFDGIATSERKHFSNFHHVAPAIKFRSSSLVEVPLPAESLPHPSISVFIRGREGCGRGSSRKGGVCEEVNQEGSLGEGLIKEGRDR